MTKFDTKVTKILKSDINVKSMAQSWVMNTQARSIGSEAMATAVDNKKRIMSSSLFADDAPRYQSRNNNYEPPQPQNQSFNRQPQQYQDQTNYSSPPRIDIAQPVYSSQPMNQIPDFVPLSFPQPPEIITNFKTRPQMRNYGGRRLDVLPNDEMHKIRDFLITDSTNISKRLRQIGQN